GRRHHGLEQLAQRGGETGSGAGGLVEVEVRLGELQLDQGRFAAGQPDQVDPGVQKGLRDGGEHLLGEVDLVRGWGARLRPDVVRAGHAGGQYGRAPDRVAETAVEVEE